MTSEAGKKADHTPGPWVLIRQDGREASAIATIEPAPETMVEPNYWTVASVNGRRDEWAANARLIAAAPDLLTVLQRIVNNPEARIGGHIRAEAVAAITKAAALASAEPAPNLERAVAQREGTR